MKNVSIFVALLLVLQLTLPFSIHAQAEEMVDTNETVNYLALGDSLAAGMNEKSEIGFGYTDYIAKSYGEEMGPIQFNKGFAYPGYTTVNVLEDIQKNVTKPLYDLNGLSQATTTIQEAIKQADFITLSVGANDVLKNVSRSETGEFTFDAAGIFKGIQEVAVNYEKIFAEIYKLNPEVDILVMGLYNPYPYLQDEAIQTQLNTLVSTMNNSLKAVVEKNDGYFSDVTELIGSNVAAYLPNPQNIHLSAVGYEAVAANMLTDYFAAILVQIEEVLDELFPVGEDYFTDISNHGSKDYINLAYASGFMNGYEDGTFKPNTEMTRAQVLSVISRAFGLTATKPAPFKDISHYAQKTQDEIAAAYEAGLVKENDGYFNPQGKITRSQLALILTRLSNTLVGTAYVPTAMAPFKDITTYDQETQIAITYLYDFGMVQGTTANTYSPKGTVTRAHLAKILVLAMSEE